MVPIGIPCVEISYAYSENLDSLNIHNACLVGISVDGPWSHPAYAEALSLRFPLAADFEPKGAVAPSYGVYRDDDGVAEPALFVIDGTGRIAWNHVSPMDVNPGWDRGSRAGLGSRLGDSRRVWRL